MCQPAAVTAARLSRILVFLFVQHCECFILCWVILYCVECALLCSWMIEQCSGFFSPLFVFFLRVWYIDWGSIWLRSVSTYTHAETHQNLWKPTNRTPRILAEVSKLLILRCIPDKAEQIQSIHNKKDWESESSGTPDRVKSFWLRCKTKAAVQTENFQGIFVETV